MRILTITGLFPNCSDPTHGIFILERVKGIIRRGHEVRVIAPVLYVPPGPVPERHRPLRAVPATEEIEGIRVDHPRFFAIPRAVCLHARTYAWGIEPAVRKVVNLFQPDIIDINYLYPDGCGAARVSRKLGLPFVCSARGSDVKYFGRRRMFSGQIRRALTGAAAVFAVSRDLARELHDLGIFDGEITVVRNGVDREKFRPLDRERVRKRLGLPLTRPLGICVAHFVQEHRHDLLIRALRHPDAPQDLMLLLVGHGELRARLERLTVDLGLEERVRFLGPVPHSEVPQWLSSSNISILLSERTGCPNFVLESSACNIPCVLSDIPEMRELIRLGHRGQLVSIEEGAVARGMAAALEVGEGAPEPNTVKVRTWDHVACDILRHFMVVLASREVIQGGCPGSRAKESPQIS